MMPFKSVLENKAVGEHIAACKVVYESAPNDSDLLPSIRRLIAQANQWVYSKDDYYDLSKYFSQRDGYAGPKIIKTAMNLSQALKKGCHAHYFADGKLILTLSPSGFDL